MVDSVACLRYAECSRAPDYITNGYGCPMQTTSCTWPDRHDLAPCAANSLLGRAYR